MKRKLVSFILVAFLLLTTACSTGTSSKKPENPIKNFVDVVKDSANGSAEDRLPKIYEAGSWILGLSEDEIETSGYFEKDDRGYRIENLTIFNCEGYLSLDTFQDKGIRSFTVFVHNYSPSSSEDAKIVAQYQKSADSKRTVYSVNGDTVDNYESFSKRVTNDSKFSVYLPNCVKYHGETYTVSISKTFMDLKIKDFTPYYFYQYTLSYPKMTENVK